MIDPEPEAVQERIDLDVAEGPGEDRVRIARGSCGEGEKKADPEGANRIRL